MLRPIHLSALATAVSLHAATSEAVALCAAVNLPDQAEAPDWVHVLPAGEIRTLDGRGPYRVPDAGELARLSLQAGDRLPIDENHATDLAAPRGDPAPARGWVVELQARQDGLWGRVEWTEEGRRLVGGRAYRGISPVIQHRKDGTVTALLRASLVNRPNMRGLTALHFPASPSGLPALHASSPETNMNLLEKLLAALGLPAATTEEAAIAAVTTLHQAQAASSTALQSALAPIAKAAGLAESSDAAAVLAGVEALAGGEEATITALQAELVTLANELKTLKDSGSRARAEAFVDAAIKAGRVGVKPRRDSYITRHMANPAEVEADINALPSLIGSGQIVPATPPAANGEIALNAEQLKAAALLGVDAKAYAATLKAERDAREAAL